MSDGDHVEMMIEAWPFTMLDNQILLDHKSINGGLLTDGDVVTYIFLMLRGQRNGKVWSNRAGMAEDHGIGRSTLLERIARLEKTGWLSKRVESPAGVPRVVLRLRVLGDEAPVLTNPQAEISRGPESRTPESRISDPRVQLSGPISKRKKKKKEEVKQKTASAYADANRLTKEEDPLVKNEKRDDEQEKSTKREKRATPLAPTTNVPRKPIEKAVKDERPGKVKPPSPKGKSTRVRSSSAPSRSPSVNRLWTVWTTEVKARWPDFAVPAETPKHIGQVRHLFKQFGEENAEKIIRVAVWDWDAIRETIMVWKTKDVAVPQPGDILVVSTQLAAHVASGVHSPCYRVSEYHKRFIAAPIKSTKNANGLSLAAQMREKYRPS